MRKLMKKVMELVEVYEKTTQDQKTREELVMVIGETGSGKSSLINYINGVPLEAFSDDGQIYKLKVAAGSTSLPGIEIGHGTSCTRHPVVYSPDQKGFSYIDTPGFGDTGDRVADRESEITQDEARIAQDIANAYFRSVITKRAVRFKLVLVMDYDAIVDHRRPTRALSDLERFVQTIGSDNADVLETIKSATCIVVTKLKNTSAENKEEEEEIALTVNTINVLRKLNDPAHNCSSLIQEQETKLAALLGKNTRKSPIDLVKEKLARFIESSPMLSGEMRNFLTGIQVSVFTKPTQSGVSLADDEAKQIRELVETRLSFVPIANANISIRVSRENEGHVLREIRDGFSEISQGLSRNIDEYIREKLKIAFEETSLEKTKALEVAINRIMTAPNPVNLKTFINIMCDAFGILNTTAIYKKFEELDSFLSFLVGLLPPIEHDTYLVKDWGEELGLKDILHKYMVSVRKLLSAPKDDCSDGKLTIKGFYIRTSQVAECIKRFSEEKRQIENIEIQSLHAIIVDSDLADTNPVCAEKLAGVNVSMIAPKMVVDGNRLINLSGKDGDAFDVVEAKNGDATNGVGTAGENGLPGQSGGNAGSLFIVCDESFNQDFLSVKLNGGNGARGQDAGNGGDGKDGSAAIAGPKSSLSSAWVINRQGSSETHEYSNRTVTIQSYILHGEQGGAGGDTGKRGQGGFAGQEGECRIVVANQLANLGERLIAEKGKSGDPGELGTVGEAGTNGESQIGTWRAGGKKHRDHWTSGPQSIGSILGAASPGKLLTELCPATLPVQKKPQNFAKILLDYKVFLTQASKGLAVIGESLILRTLDAFNEHCEDLQNSGLLRVSVNDVLVEAGTLEKYDAQFRREGEVVDLVPLYYSLLDRIKAMDENPDRTPEELRGLEYLYVVMLGKVVSLNAAEDSLMPNNIEKHVENLISNFETLEKLKADQLRKYYRKQYQEKIEGRIEEARRLLERLGKDIQNREAEIEPAINKLEAEVRQAKTAGDACKSALQKKEKQLKQALKERAKLRVFNFVAQGISTMLFPLYYGSITIPAMIGRVTHGREQEVVGMVSPVIGEVMGLLNEQKEGKEQLRNLRNQIAKIDEHTAKLDGYLNNTVPALGHSLRGTVHEARDFQGELQDRSLGALEFSKLKIKQFFEEVKKNIGIVLGEFETRADFVGIATRMNEVLDTSVNICVRIQEDRDHMAFADYIARLHTPRLEAIDLGPEYEALNNKISENVLQAAYARIVAAILQGGFPDPEKFLGAIPNLNANALDCGTMTRNLRSIKEGLIEYSTSLTKRDQFSFENVFDRDNSAPFFTWSYAEYPQKISSLLQGEEVFLTAYAADALWDAVKFNKVGIHFECGNTKEQAELDNVLQQNFEVTLGHSGVSYYKYGENVYQIATDKLVTIQHSFKMRSDNVTPVEYNGVCKKMTTGDILLSPYTTWTIKISPRQPATESSKLLDKLRTVLPNLENVKLDLVGDGVYIKREHVKSKLWLPHYYRLVQTQEPAKEAARMHFNTTGSAQEQPALTEQLNNHAISKQAR